MKSSTRVVMLPLCTAFIFLCAQFSTEAQPQTNYARLALQAEREAYDATTTDDFNAALWRKVESQKQAGMFADASLSLSRMKLFALDDADIERYYYERVLCAYLDGEFAAARSAAAEARAMVADTLRKSQIVMLDGLAAAAEGKRKEAEQILNSWAEGALSADKAAAFKDDIDRYFDHVPRMKNPEAGYWLSIIPGGGQLYAGEPLSAAAAASVNLGLIAFGVFEAIGGYWWTAWFVGCGLLSSTYFVNLERGRELTLRRNMRVAADYNRGLKSIVIEAAE